MESCVAGRVHPRQLAFALPHAESLSRDNFLEGPANTAGLALVDSWPDWPNRTMLLEGPEGSGKSHLAAIWAEQAGAGRRGLRADHRTRATVRDRGRAARSTVTTAHGADGVAIAARRSVVSRADRQILRGPPDGRRRDRGKLSRDQDRAVIRRRATGRR